MIQQHMTLYMKKAAILLATAGVAVLSASCMKEQFAELDYVTEGKDVKITVPVDIPWMEVRTRADISDNDRDGIKSLWIAVFSASGQMTSRKDVNSAAGWIKVPQDSDYNEPAYEEVTLYAASGHSYIVGVANVDNYGVTSDAPGERKLLSELLTDGMTWEEFNKIAVASFPDDTHAETHINAPDVENGLPMSGCFCPVAPGGNHPADWSTENFTTTFIPSSTNENKTVTLSGAIHLRRLVSHITFNIEPAGDVVDVSVEGYSISNVPKYSWLYEQGTNFGDQAATKDKAADYYQAPVRFGAQYVTTDNTGHSFDFWMAENKHTGNAQKYNDREVKSASSTADNVLYTTLTGDSWTSNNMASYVTVQCLVTYKNLANVDEDGLTNGETSPVYRTGAAEYTIHLGYMKGDAADFNSYRNTSYTYKISISGLNEIVVEANQGTERNSAEGIVTDVENRTIHLDAHYSVFNIAFTETELSDIENFGYIVTTYENGTAYTYTDADEVSGEDRKYIDWIELKSTTDATTLATYSPASRGTYTATADAVMPIDEFHHKVSENKDNLSGVFTKNADGNYYFTVFVNEYTYEPRYGDTGWGKEGENKIWHTYVNQPSRHFYFRVRRKVSYDGNSVYARSKYAVSQESIQTYYSSLTDQATAVGIEHTNEMQGLNLRRSFQDTGNDANGNPHKSGVNGRYNTGRWITTRGTVTNPSWSSFVQNTVMLKVPAVNSNNGLQGGPQIASIESGWNPASGQQDATGFGYLQALQQYGGTNLYSSQYDPQGSSNNRAYYIEAINACTNRNRDEDGDGYIDNEELKWYVPASGKYLRAILGRNSLTDPIMPYSEITSLKSTDNGQNTRWFLYASDDKVIWAMEGLSSSDWTYRQNNNYDRIPWNVRCIRNLGTDLTNIVNTEKVDMAYVHDATNRKVKMTYYDNASIRTEKITANGNSGTGGSMGIHPTTDPLNKVYYAFEYSDGFSETSYLYVSNQGQTNEQLRPTNTIVRDVISNDTANPCYGMEGDGWRLPNQKELAIMRNLNLFEAMPTYKSGTSPFNFVISCTYNYFTTDGKGTDQGTPTYTLTNNSPNHYLMVTRKDGGTQLLKNRNDLRLFYRCVRDVEP